MKKYFCKIFLALLITITPFALMAHHLPADSIQTAIKGKVWKKVFQKNILLQIGLDLEPTDHERIENIAFLSKINVGIGYRFVLNKHWSIHPEGWFHQFATPRLTLISDNKLELDKSRIQINDTVSILRMAGYNIGVSVQRHLPFGLSVSGGLQCGWYNKGVVESGTMITDREGSSIRSETKAYVGNNDLPKWFNKVQPGLEFGLEKTFLQRAVVGVRVYQGLADLTGFPEGGRNFSTNYFGYVGVRL